MVYTVAASKAFMAGPIAARIVGPGASLLLPAGLVGALLVLVADLVAQFAFGTRYPVGVVTGADEARHTGEEHGGWSSTGWSGQVDGRWRHPGSCSG